MAAIFQNGRRAQGIQTSFYDKILMKYKLTMCLVAPDRELNYLQNDTKHATLHHDLHNNKGSKH